MSKAQLACVLGGGWITVHLGLVVLGFVFGIGAGINLPFHSEPEVLHCQEDEVAIHGGLENWYDSDEPLECVTFEDFPELLPPPTPVVGEAWSMTPVPTPMPTPTPRLMMEVALTYYACPPFCVGDPMFNGQELHPNAVACGWALNEGQRFIFRGEEFMCEDRGYGPYAWVDFWKGDHYTGQQWQALVGMAGVITLVD
jgi:hypothetical protein